SGANPHRVSNKTEKDTVAVARQGNRFGAFGARGRSSSLLDTKGVTHIGHQRTLDSPKIDLLQHRLDWSGSKEARTLEEIGNTIPSTSCASSRRSFFTPTVGVKSMSRATSFIGVVGPIESGVAAWESSMGPCPTAPNGRWSPPTSFRSIGASTSDGPCPSQAQKPALTSVTTVLFLRPRGRKLVVGTKLAFQLGMNLDFGNGQETSQSDETSGQNSDTAARRFQRMTVDEFLSKKGFGRKAHPPRARPP
ncbi:hypothetical protein THAOC_24987, partial [Thalassiosira oceanica]